MRHVYPFLYFLLAIFPAVSLANTMVPGTIAVYSDGTVERLVAVNGREQTWEDQRLRVIVRDQNPLMPDLSRRQRLRGLDFRQALRRGSPDTLLQAKPGALVEFNVQRWDGLNNAALQPRHFECRYEGKRTLTIQGKAESTKRFSCVRYSIHHKLWTRDVKAEYEIDFSERLGMPVRTKTVRGQRSKVRRLVALIASDQYSYKRLNQILKSMHDKPKGK